MAPGVKTNKACHEKLYKEVAHVAIDFFKEMG